MYRCTTCGMSSRAGRGRSPRPAAWRRLLDQARRGWALGALTLEGAAARARQGRAGQGAAAAGRYPGWVPGCPDPRGRGRARRDELGKVLPLLGELPFLPAEAFRLQRCVELAASLPPPLAERLEALVLAGGRALATARQGGRLRTLAGFAGALPARVGQAAFQRLNRLHNSVA